MKLQYGLHLFISLGHSPMLPYCNAQHVLPAGIPVLYWCWCPKTGGKLCSLAVLVLVWLRIFKKTYDQVPWGRIVTFAILSDGNLAFKSSRHLQRSCANFILFWFFPLLFLLNYDTMASFQVWETQHGLELLVPGFSSVVCFSNYLSKKTLHLG